MQSEVRDRIIARLDVETWREVTKIVYELTPYVGTFQISSQAISSLGLPDLVAYVQRAGSQVMVDLPLYGTPEELEKTVSILAKQGVSFFTVSMANSRASLKAIVKNKGTAKAIGVVTLDSFNDEADQNLYKRNRKQAVTYLSMMAYVADLDGIVCSAQDLISLSLDYGAHDQKQKLVIASIWPKWKIKQNSTRRTVTPASAIRLGASHLLFGKALTQASLESDICLDSAKSITSEVSKAFDEWG